MLEVQHRGPSELHEALWLFQGTQILSEVLKNLHQHWGLSWVTFFLLMPQQRQWAQCSWTPPSPAPCSTEMQCTCKGRCMPCLIHILSPLGPVQMKLTVHVHAQGAILGLILIFPCLPRRCQHSSSSILQHITIPTSEAFNIFSKGA